MKVRVLTILPLDYLVQEDSDKLRKVNLLLSLIQMSPYPFCLHSEVCLEMCINFIYQAVVFMGICWSSKWTIATSLGERISCFITKFSLLPTQLFVLFLRRVRSTSSSDFFQSVLLLCMVLVLFCFALLFHSKARARMEWVKMRGRILDGWENSVIIDDRKYSINQKKYQ